MKLRLSSREIRLIGAVILGVGLVCLTLVLISHFVKESFFQTMEARARVSGKIDLASRTNPFVIRKKIEVPDTAPATPPSVNPPATTDENDTAVQWIIKTDSEGEASQNPSASNPVQASDASSQAVPGATSGGTDPAPVAVARNTASYPYSLHLASCRQKENCRNIVQQYENADINAFMRRVDLGDKGIWHRVYLGKFESRKQARDARQQYNLPQSRIVKIQ